jgi:hypothetical protein
MRNVASELESLLRRSRNQSEIGLLPGTVGLCTHVRRMRSDRESAFYLCELSKVDQRFPKYPRLPVFFLFGI